MTLLNKQIVNITKNLYINSLRHYCITDFITLGAHFVNFGQALKDERTQRNNFFVVFMCVVLVNLNFSVFF